MYRFTSSEGVMFGPAYNKTEKTCPYINCYHTYRFMQNVSNHARIS